MARGKNKKQSEPGTAKVQLNHPGISYQSILKVSKLVKVDVKMKFIHFDQLSDGTWRLTYTKGELQHD